MQRVNVWKSIFCTKQVERELTAIYAPRSIHETAIYALEPQNSTIKITVKAATYDMATD
jgi:hypothetical protein